MCKEHSHHTTCCCHEQKEHSHHSHSHTDGCSCGCGCHQHSHEGEASAWRTLWPMIASSALLLWGILANPFPAYEWLLFIIAYLPLGCPILKEAWEEVREGDVFNEFTLMLLATVGAFAIGEYPEAVGVLLFYSVGEYFQDKAVGRARRDIQALVNLRPETATVVDSDGERQKRKPEEVKVGEVVEVVTGGRVPLDGRLLTPHAEFDTAALTGESMPRSFEQGEEVAAGVIALGQVVRIEVTKPYAESALQRILHLVEEASSRKSHAEMFIRQFAHVYTPIVIALAVVTALVPPLFVGGWSTWVYRALVFLVISCPCALVVSIPLAYFRGIGVASRKGILFKGGNFLDAVTQLTHVVFDKTGTLTTGTFAVEEVVAAEGVSQECLLQMVAAVERKSTHPIARALVAKAQSLPTLEAAEVSEEAGRGLRAEVGGQEVIVGRAEWLTSQNIEIRGRAKENAAYTYVYCALNGKFAGRIALADQPRPDAAQTIARLHCLGIAHVGMLSGDRLPVVKQLAEHLGVDHYCAELLPEGKVEQMQRVKQQLPKGEKVAFVGDGINDAPVLALSDVAFAMGDKGADAAVETADVVIQTDQLQRIADAVQIGRLTRTLVRCNIGLALGIKIGVMAASALGFASLWAAVLADTGVALLCVANTYFIRK